jgi:excisionase family DNA binding protein
MSVSYPTLKQWIYKGKIRSVKTPGGHHRIPHKKFSGWPGRSKNIFQISKSNPNLT